MNISGCPSKDHWLCCLPVQLRNCARNSLIYALQTSKHNCNAGHQERNLQASGAN